MTGLLGSAVFFGDNWAVFSPSSWLDSVSQIARALFEWNAFRSMNDRGK